MAKGILSIKYVFQFYPRVCSKHFFDPLNTLRASIELNAEIRVYLHVKWPLLLYDINNKT
jgi:hypothetical protein